MFCAKKAKASGRRLDDTQMITLHHSHNVCLLTYTPAATIKPRLLLLGLTGSAAPPTRSITTLTNTSTSSSMDKQDWMKLISRRRVRLCFRVISSSRQSSPFNVDRRRRRLKKTRRRQDVDSSGRMKRVNRKKSSSCLMSPCKCFLLLSLHLLHPHTPSANTA